jgi:hypothetical protein
MGLSRPKLVAIGLDVGLGASLQDCCGGRTRVDASQKDRTNCVALSTLLPLHTSCGQHQQTAKIIVRCTKHRGRGLTDDSMITLWHPDAIATSTGTRCIGGDVNCVNALMIGFPWPHHLFSSFSRMRLIVGMLVT